MAEIMKEVEESNINKSGFLYAVYVMSLLSCFTILFPATYEDSIRSAIIGLVILLVGVALVITCYLVRGGYVGVNKEHCQFFINFFWFQVKLGIFYLLSLILTLVFAGGFIVYYELEFLLVNRLFQGLITAFEFYVYATCFRRFLQGKPPMEFFR